MKKVYKKTGGTTIVVIEQRKVIDFSNAFEATRFALVAEINAMRHYILNTNFQLRCSVLEKVIEEIDAKLGYKNE